MQEIRKTWKTLTPRKILRMELGCPIYWIRIQDWTKVKATGQKQGKENNKKTNGKALSLSKGGFASSHFLDGLIMAGPARRI